VDANADSSTSSAQLGKTAGLLAWAIPDACYPGGRRTIRCLPVESIIRGEL
jgi:hypothetical protein